MIKLDHIHSITDFQQNPKVRIAYSLVIPCDDSLRLQSQVGGLDYVY
jgi:hypothetical protein